MACLLDLPTEILHHIAQYLAETPIRNCEDHKFCNLRLTCRTPCIKTECECSRTAFSTVRLGLHSKNLQRLLNISKRPALGKAVKKLVFVHREHPHEYVAFPQPPDDEAGDFKEQVLSVLGKIFEETFSGTPNLKEIVIVTPCEARFRRHNDVLPADFMAMDRASNDAIHIEEVRVTAEALYILITQALIHTGVHLSAFGMEITGSV
jgi:hypothetical protein